MAEPKIRRTQIRARDTLHLLGGVRAGTHAAGHLVIFPSRDRSAILVPSVVSSQSYWNAIKAFGLDIVGHETETEEGGIRHSEWHLFEPGVHLLQSALVTWSHIAYAAHQKNEFDVANLARDISFSLRAADLRLRDVSRAYGWQNHYATWTECVPGRHFANVELVDLYLALHSFLAEASAARDYLAKFIASMMLGFTDIDSMAKLYRQLRKSDAENEIARLVLRICERGNPAGWMACLSEHRNLVLHRSPITRWSEKKYLVANALSVGNYEVLTIHLGLPRDPINNSGGEFIDALLHFRDLLHLLLQFASEVARASPIRPEMPQITPVDLV